MRPFPESAAADSLYAFASGTRHEAGRYGVLTPLRRPQIRRGPTLA
jgi:hypothetical protein